MKVFILLIFIFLTSTLNISAQTSDRERGIEAFNQKKYAKAIEFFEKAIKADSEDVTSLCYLGQSFESLEKRNEAIENYTLCYQTGLIVLEKTFFETMSDKNSPANKIEHVKNKIRDKIELSLKSSERLQIIESSSAQNPYLQDSLLIFKYFLKDKETNPQNSPDNSENKKLKIIKKPNPAYTKRAIKNRTSGEIQVYVMFLANGRVGIVIPKTFLPDDLTNAAIEAARTIEFEPQTLNGKPVTVIKTVVYTFVI